MPLITFFGVAGRFAGDLLTSALGWASSLLFGRVPRSHQIMLVAMMAGSILWIIVILGLLIPGIIALFLTSIPHPGFLTAGSLGVVFLGGLILLPLGIGLGGYLVPSSEERLRGLAAGREILRGYLFAPILSALLVFLTAVGLIRKLRSLRHGWSDTHVPIVVSPDGYEQMLIDLQTALRAADLKVRAHDAPWVLTLPAQILNRVAGANIRQLRPDRLVELSARDLRIGLYPSDIAISGSLELRARARAAIVSRLATTSAHLTTSAEAQALEDQLERLAKRDRGKRLDAAAVQAQFKSIDEKLSILVVPTDEWDTLFRIRLQIERDLLVGDTPGTNFPGHGGQASGDGVQTAVIDRPSAHLSPEKDIPMSKKRTVATGTPASVAWLGTALLSLAAFVLLTLAVAGHLSFPFDAPILALARTLDGAPIVWNTFSQSANFPLIAIAIVFMLWLVRIKRYREAGLVLVMLIAITAGSEGIKQLTGRVRPSGSGDGIPGVVYSYPSGHVLEVMTILGALVIRAWRSSAAFRLRLIFFFLVALEVVFVAIARMALNEHFPTDIIAGALGSSTALGFYGWFTRAGGWADHPTRKRRTRS